MPPHFASLFSLAFLTLFSGACGAPRERPSLIVDTAGTSAVELYDLGASQLALGNLDEAEALFRQSLSVARRSGLDFAPPHEGMARLKLRQNDLDEALAFAMHSQELDRFWTPVYWVLGKIAEREDNPDLALVHYQRGLIGAPADAELTGAAADLLTRLGRTDEANEILERSRRQSAAKSSGADGTPRPRDARPGGTSTGSAGKDKAQPPDLKTRQQLESFFPDDQTDLTPPVLAVFQQANFTRGALAILITGDGEHGLAGALNRSGITDGAVAPPVDVQRRPEAPWIARALAMGLMEDFPDGTFRPDQVMTRLTLSLWIEETIARLQNNRRVFELYRGQKSPFQDVPDGHYGLNAARIVADLEILKPRSDGTFGLEDPVPVEEGIEAVRRLGPALLGAGQNR